MFCPLFFLAFFGNFLSAVDADFDGTRGSFESFSATSAGLFDKFFAVNLKTGSRLSRVDLLITFDGAIFLRGVARVKIFSASRTDFLRSRRNFDFACFNLRRIGFDLLRVIAVLPNIVGAFFRAVFSLRVNRRKRFSADRTSFFDRLLRLKIFFVIFL